MWMEHRQVLWRTRLEAPDMERWKRRIYNLRAQMLQWIQQVLTFTTQDVLEANWKRLEVKLAKVQTVDQLIQDHVDYLDVCLKECMLTTDRLLPVSLTVMRFRPSALQLICPFSQPLMKTIDTVFQFAQYQPRLSRALQRYLADPRGESEIDKVNSRWDTFHKFESHFSHNVAVSTISLASHTNHDVQLGKYYRHNMTRCPSK
jgi:gamma-tubulin complex component 2